MPKTREQKEKLAKLLAEEVPVTKALEQAGWAHKQALKGWDKVPRDVIAMLPKKAQKLIELGKMGKKDMEHFALGRLVKNVQDGRDGGAQSAKILGSHREINAWTPDNQMGAIVLVCPREILEQKDEMLAKLTAAEAADGKPAGHWRTIRRADGAEATEWVESV